MSEGQNIWKIITDKETLAAGGIFLGIISAIFGAGRKIQKRISLMDSRMEQMEKRQVIVEANQTELASLLAMMDKDLKQRLYHNDGAPIYRSVDECLRSMDNCPAKDATRRIEHKVDMLIEHLIEKGKTPQ